MNLSNSSTTIILEDCHFNDDRFYFATSTHENNIQEPNIMQGFKCTCIVMYLALNR